MFLQFLAVFLSMATFAASFVTGIVIRTEYEFAVP